MDSDIAAQKESLIGVSRMTYRMEPETLEFLVSQPGQDLLDKVAEQVAAEKSALTLLSGLRKTYTQKQAAAALELTRLRLRAETKFSRAHQMYFTREALEQSSSEAISSYRAKRYTGFSSIADLGCGIGGDTIQLGRIAQVVAVERDTLRLRMAKLNAGAYGVSNQVDFAGVDYTRAVLPDVQAVFLDPSRRRGGRRVYSIHDYAPPLTILGQLLARTSSIGVKMSPGVRYLELGALDLDFELEFISQNGACKEGLLWLGDLRTDCSRRATILPDGASLTNHDGTEKVTLEQPGNYLYNPDGAVVRAHLVEHLASREGLAKIDNRIAYLTSDRLVGTPFATAFVVEESHPFNLKRLNERLRKLDVGYVTIMKRGSPIQPEVFRRRLKLQGSVGRTLVFTRVLGRPHMLICSDVHQS